MVGGLFVFLHTLLSLTAPVRLSTLQSGMILDSVTIQLLILSRRLLSTDKTETRFRARPTLFILQNNSPVKTDLQTYLRCAELVASRPWAPADPPPSC